MSASPVDPTRCPLCGGDNSCGMARGAGTCWCFATRIPEDVLDRVPPEQRELACVCERCASGAPAHADADAAADAADTTRGTTSDTTSTSHDQPDQDLARLARER